MGCRQGRRWIWGNFTRSFSAGLPGGAPLAAVIANTNTRSGDYDKLRDVPRPGHADYTAQVRYKGYQDVRGGGHFSGRLTAPLCIAGGICKQMLARRGIWVGAHIAAIGGICRSYLPGGSLGRPAAEPHGRNGTDLGSSAEGPLPSTGGEGGETNAIGHSGGPVPG